jgi:hypothetical protein
MKQIEEITETDLLELWSAIGGAPHLFEYGKDELKQVLTTGECAMERQAPDGYEVEPISLQLDYYTMAAIVDILRKNGYETPISSVGSLTQDELIKELEDKRITKLMQEFDSVTPRLFEGIPSRQYQDLYHLSLKHTAEHLLDKFSITVGSEDQSKKGIEDVTRVEVIDEKGRSYVNWKDGNKVILSYQDEGKTLKIFIK